VQTVDFFTPIVDDPYQYGAIAAANSLSDVYAMGGEVLFALNVCGFPSTMPPEVQIEILKGGAEKVREAGAVLVGGHTIVDQEPKYGLAVTGRIHPDAVLAKGGGRPGDVVILTKPLGVGIITTALKGGVAAADHVEGAVESMVRLNGTAGALLRELGAGACTDVTGFALIGHALELAEKGGVGLRFHLDRLPFLPGAEGYAQESLFPCGTRTNRSCYDKDVKVESTIPEETELLLYTPETSGGLLATLAPDAVASAEKRFRAAGEPFWIIGEVVAGSGVAVVAS
jgi:selenide,water dikinase